jgi:multidrug efflux pump
VEPKYWQSPDTLRDLWISTAGGTVSGSQSTNAVAGTVVSNATSGNHTAASIAADTARNLATNSLANTGRGAVSTGSAVTIAAEPTIPLAAFAHYAPGNTPLAVNHQSTFVATTISFNIAPNASFSQAQEAITRTVNELHMPTTIHGGFAGTGQAAEQSFAKEPVLILAALATVYIVLGVLYESYIHPITILSTLPSAGAGAVLALRLFGQEFSIIALIGVFLLIGIVKKNAIMMIDFALEAQREGRSPADAIYTAALLRFRPIMMTTMAAMLGAVPLVFGLHGLASGDGAETRQPLGISIVGGLAVSQVLTLYTTPVMYTYLDRFGAWCNRLWARLHPLTPPATPAEPAQV